MKVENYHNVYFLGIGGIGMSALARWFRHNGKRVAGYDRTSSELTLLLEQEGIEINYADEESHIPAWIKEDAANTMVVYTPAIPPANRQLNWLRQEGYLSLKRSQVLGELTRKNRTLAVAGTHGKTTTSCMAAHLLKYGNLNTAAFLGGIAVNYNSNVLFNNSESNVTVVVEADEYDRSFLTLHPDIAIVTSMDADHLDIYGEHKALQESFREFAHKVAPGGVVIAHHSIAQLLRPEGNQYHLLSYGSKESYANAYNVRPADGHFHFDMNVNGEVIMDITLPMPGFHNVENATAAMVAGRLLGISAEVLREGFRTFRGVKRRFEYVVKGKKIVFIDDYAHHPEEISALLKSVKALFPEKKITVVFQPHLYTRTRDFAEGFSDSLSLADEVVMLPIYPAREESIPGVTAEMLLEGITTAKVMSSKNTLLQDLAALQPEVLLTVGAGDIDRLVEPIKKWIKETGHADELTV